MFKKAKYAAGLVLILILFFEAFFYWLWLKENNFFGFSVNTHMHSLEALRFYGLFYSDADASQIIKAFFSPSLWPRLHYLFTAIAIDLFGRSYVSMGLVNIFYLAVLIISVFGITFKIAKNTKVSLASALIVSLYPGIVRFMGFYELQMGVSAFTALSVYLLLLSDSFTKRLFCLLFAFSFTFAMYLDRMTPLVFILGPVLYVLANSFKKADRRVFVKTILPNVMLTCMIAGLMLGLFYIPWFLGLDMNDLFSQKGLSGLSVWSESMNSSPAILLKRLGFYFLILPIYHLGIFWTAVFLFCLYFFFKSEIQDKGVLVWWLMAPLILFTMLPKKDFSYTIPGLVPMGMISALGLHDFYQKSKSLLIYVFILCFGVFQFFIILFAPAELYAKLFIPFDYRSDRTVANIGSVYYNKPLCSWITTEVAGCFPQNEKLSVAIVKDEHCVGWLDFELGGTLLLRNPLNDISLLYLESELDNFSLLRYDYLVFIENKDSYLTLEEAVKRAFIFRNRTHPGGFSDYTLIKQKNCPSYPVKVSIYRKNSSLKYKSESR